MSALPSLDSVVTPALLVDGPTLVENVARMAARTNAADVELWPHMKTHKSRQIAQLQHEHGAAGLTVATVREAVCFAEAGFERLLIAYPPVGDWRLDALLGLAREIEVRVVVDALETAALLDQAGRRAGLTVAYLLHCLCHEVGGCGAASIQALSAERSDSRTRCFAGISLSVRQRANGPNRTALKPFRSCPRPARPRINASRATAPSPRPGFSVLRGELPGPENKAYPFDCVPRLAVGVTGACGRGLVL